MKDSAYWVSRLGLLPHPEGGFYREVFRSGQAVSRASSSAIKSACTSIHYLLEGTDYSGFHRIASDELWYFHQGVALLIHVISPEGEYQALELSGSENGQLSQVVPAGSWFAAELPSKDGFALVSCAVAPGFEFSEFEMAGRESLLQAYPQYRDEIERLCRC